MAVELINPLLGAFVLVHDISSFVNVPRRVAVVILMRPEL